MSRRTDSDTPAFHTDTIQVKFLNFTIERHRWTIVDLANDQTIYDDFLEAREEAGDRVTLTVASDGVTGNAKYKREDSDFTNVSLLTDGQEVLMT